jgi:Arc/MetJ family transcription regulator
MRTNIDIDDKLMAQAMRASGKATKRAVVEDALRLLVRTRRQAGIRSLKGKVEWDGDLDEMRADPLRRA